MPFDARSDLGPSFARADPAPGPGGRGAGTAVFIAVAGKAAHLAGVVAAHTVRPVIGVPVESAALGGMDALLSTVQMPKGIPVATVALGKAGGTNAALLAVEILALGRRRPPGKARRPPEEDGREGRGELEEAPREGMTSFAIRNFGCRVNQAEAFAWAEELRRRRARGSRRTRDTSDYRPRQFLHPDRAGGPGRAAVHPPGRPGQPGRPARRDRLLRRTSIARNSAGCPASGWSSRTPEKDGLAARILEATGPREGNAVEAGTRSLTGRGPSSRSRTAAISDARTASSRASAGEARASRATKSSGERGGSVADGYREIVLAGIHLCSYGRDLEPRSSLLALLDRIEAVEGLGRVRLSSLDPRFVDGPLVGPRRGEPSDRAAFPPVPPERLGEGPSGDGQGVGSRRLRGDPRGPAAPVARTRPSARISSSASPAKRTKSSSETRGSSSGRR